MDPPRISPPRLYPRAHLRTPSLSPSRSPTRQRITDDLLSHLSPTTTLEAFRSPSGKLRASVEAATPSERAFGIRATVASKKIQEWVDELSAWPWPAGNGSAGFQLPSAKRRRISADRPPHTPTSPNGYEGTGTLVNGDEEEEEEEYIGSLPSEDVLQYETRIDEIHEDMEDLNVEEIKSTVLNTHFSPRSRPSSSGSNAASMIPSLFASYTRMDDFTAIVTATVLQALPNLSKLMRLMDAWTIRLLVLRKVPTLLSALEEAEVELKSGWQAINVPRQQNHHNYTNEQQKEEIFLERETYVTMRDSLQDKVTTLGQDLDYMLDTLEGREDTLPEIWLDRMENIEKDYGEWVVTGDKTVREGEWAKIARARKAEEDRIRAEEEVREVARLRAEKERKEREEKLRMEAEEDARRRAEVERKEKEERLRIEAEEAARQRAEVERKEREEKLRIEAEEDARQRAEVERKEREERLRIEAEEAARQRAEVERKETEEKLRMEAEEAARQRAEVERKENEDRLRLEEEAAAEYVRQQSEMVREREENALRLKEREAAEAAEAIRIQKEEESRKQLEDELRAKAEETAKADEFARLREIAEVAEAIRIQEEEEISRKQLEDELRAKAEETAKADEFARLREIAEVAETIRIQEEEEISRKQLEDELRAKAEETAKFARLREIAEAAEATWIQEEKTQKHLEDELKSKAEETAKAAELARHQDAKDVEDAEAAQQHAISHDTPDPEKRAEPGSHYHDSIPIIGIGAAAAAGLMQSAEHVNTAIHRRSASIESNATDRAESPSSPTSKLSLFNGSNESKSEGSELPTVPMTTEDQHREGHKFEAMMINRNSAHTPPRRQTPPTNYWDEDPSIPRSPSPQPRAATPVAPVSASNQSLEEQYFEIGESPRRPSQSSHFGPVVANMLRRTSSSNSLNEQGPKSFSSQPQSPSVASRKLPLEPPIGAEIITPTPAFTIPTHSEPSDDAVQELEPKTPVLPKETDDGEWIVINTNEEDSSHDLQSEGECTESSDSDHPDQLGLDDLNASKSYNGTISPVSGYSASSPASEIHEAKLSDSLRLVLPPNESARWPSQATEAATSSKSTMSVSTTIKVFQASPTLDDSETSSKTPVDLILERKAETFLDPETSSNSQLIEKSDAKADEISGDAAKETVQGYSEGPELEDIAPPALVPMASDTHINNVAKRIQIPRRESTASNASTTTARQPDDQTVSPITPSSPVPENTAIEAFTGIDDDSPSKGRIGSRRGLSEDRSSPGSPPRSPPISHPHSLRLLKSPTFTKAESKDILSIPTEAPLLDNVDVSEGSVLSSPKRSTDDQIQAQISSLLESIPARILLTSEPNSSHPSDTLRPLKTRRSITSSLRSHSSLSTRAPTPSFTLAPAYGKGSSRPRPQSGNPEIKLYHLSRSTGEAPIKLFVRLVGENGERVMVRVGGGWADLGEYLREYASHHGRRSALDTDKVEIQDLPRIVSSGSTASSSATIRGNGTSSPISRPTSAFDRPMSSLHVRKMRRSVGEQDSDFTSMSIRSPSTPLPVVNRGKEYETPPSEKSRSSSRLSWTEEEGGLGLAGPKAKKVVISERDQEWVESMKEKVRLASAEKERQKARDGDRKSFGEMDRVGGTKRLFRRGGL